MNFQLFTLIFILSTLAIYPSFAGDERGNGGDAVVCYDGDDITSVELLDYYEARNTFGAKLKLEGNNYEEKVKDALLRLGQVSPKRANEYNKWLGSFTLETVFVSDVDLVDIPDSDHIIIPQKCKIEQVAIHKDPTFPEQKRYTINKNLWDRMDALNRAGLVLHELLYRETKKIGATNSVNVRYFNFLLSADQLKKYSSKLTKLIEIFHHVRFEYITIKDITYALYRRAIDHDTWEPYILKEYIHFHPNGQVRDGYALSGNYKRDNLSVNLRGRVSFKEDGRPFMLGISSEFTNYIQTASLKIILQGEGRLGFNIYEEGTPLWFISSSSYIDSIDFIDCEDSKKHFKGVKDGSFEFSSKGDLTSISAKNIAYYTDSSLLRSGFCDKTIKALSEVNYFNLLDGDLNRIADLQLKYGNEYCWKNPENHEYTKLSIFGKVTFSETGGLLSRARLWRPTSVTFQNKQVLLAVNSVIELSGNIPELSKIEIAEDVKLKNKDEVLMQYHQGEILEIFEGLVHEPR